jgi:alpha-ketoglutaric semialdehyde dehydrogenase
MHATGLSILSGNSSSDRSTTFTAINPATGEQVGPTYHAASTGEVDQAAWDARAAFETYSHTTPAQRAAFLEKCADNIAALGDSLVQMASSETGLAAPRIAGERDRTVNQFRFFAALVREGTWVDAVIDHGDPNRTPLPKPDVRRMKKPLGPVAVFGASNFPLAYSAGGGDTASALAAGCPVIIKGHPSHPGTGEMVARAISDAVRDSALHAGTYSYLHAGGSREIEVGKELITHTCIKAAGFTGSFNGGMALARLGASRAEPIPVFSEMGSVNPVFVLPGAAENEAEAIVTRLHGSVTNSTGQMCTCPGIVFVAKSAGADKLIAKLSELITATDAMPMLSTKIRDSYVSRLVQMSQVSGVQQIRGGDHAKSGITGAFGRPTLLITQFSAFSREHTLRDECFGPATLVVVCDSPEQLIEAARLIDGSLTGTICSASSDTTLATQLQATLEQRVGRLIYNGVPTGVEVAAAMVHGGPYPSTNQPNSSAVGTLAIERWARPVCYQNCPDALLPDALKEANPLGIRRRVNGKY